jgi:glycyl-tRNA synthetase beta chain
MRDHQRYFPVLGNDGKLLNKFITIRNGGSEHLEVVASGNERVLKARLSDAEFFFNEDRKIKLADRLEKIKKVVFQEGMGSMYDKSLRLINILELLNTELHLPLAEADLNRAATLSKADLVTGMVTEFTELQGTMGKEYALLDGEKPGSSTSY